MKERETSALLVAIEADDVHKIEACLRRAPSLIHKQLKDGFTPWEKTKSSSPEVVQIFLTMGADINWTDAQGRSQVRFCAEDGCLDTLEFLASKGAELDMRDNFGYRPIDKALEHDQPEVVLFLIGKGCSVDEKWLAHPPLTSPRCHSLLLSLAARDAALLAVALLQDQAVSAPGSASFAQRVKNP